MPPKSKFTKGQIAKAAIELIRENGIENLTARAIAKRLCSSACPIFTVFNSMEEVIDEAIKLARVYYGEYINEGLLDKIPFKGVGKQYIQFAKDEPRLFQLLFMTETNIKDIDHFLPGIDENYEIILNSVKVSYNLNEDDAKKLYIHLTIYTHGIATLVARRVIDITKSDIDTMLTEVFVSLLKDVRGKIK